MATAMVTATRTDSSTAKLAGTRTGPGQTVSQGSASPAPGGRRGLRCGPAIALSDIGPDG